MARDTSPDCKKCRRKGEKLFLKGDKCSSDKCVLTQRTRRESEAKGRTAQRLRGRKLSAYSIQLREKQKVKSVYGIAETQFHNYFLRAARRPNTGEALLEMLEARLDNAVYRSGFATSRPQARQFVRHGHIAVDGRRTNIPSYQVQPNQIIEVRSGRGAAAIKSIVSSSEPTVPGWLEVNRAALTARVTRMPLPDDVKDVSANLQLIVELYSK